MKCSRSSETPQGACRYPRTPFLWTGGARDLTNRRGKKPGTRAEPCLTEKKEHKGGLILRAVSDFILKVCTTPSDPALGLDGARGGRRAHYPSRARDRPRARASCRVHPFWEWSLANILTRKRHANEERIYSQARITPPRQYPAEHPEPVTRGLKCPSPRGLKCPKTWRCSGHPTRRNYPLYKGAPEPGCRTRCSGCWPRVQTHSA